MDGRMGGWMDGRESRVANFKNFANFKTLQKKIPHINFLTWIEVDVLGGPMQHIKKLHAALVVYIHMCRPKKRGYSQYPSCYISTVILGCMKSGNVV